MGMKRKHKVRGNRSGDEEIVRHFKIFQNRRRVIAGTKKEVIRSKKAMLKISIT